MPKIAEQQKCCCCGETLSITKYYKSYSNFYSKGILPICKDCFGRKFGEYARVFKSNKIAMQRMCMAFDIYFNETAFDKCDTKDDAVVGKYFRNLNLGQHSEKSFDDSLKDGIFEFSGERKKVNGVRVAYVDEYDNVQEEIDEKINPKDIEKWGIGFDTADYAELNNHYKTLKKANANTDDNQEIFIKDLCYAKMLQMKALRNNDLDNYNRLTDSYRKTFQQSGIKVVKESASTEDVSFGVSIDTIERYTPAEFYKNQDLYKDFDGIGDYIKRFLLRPLKNLQFGSKEKDFEFYVKDEENINEYDDDE